VVPRLFAQRYFVILGIVSIPFSSGLWFRVALHPQRSTWSPRGFNPLFIGAVVPRRMVLPTEAASQVWFQSPFHRGCGSESNSCNRNPAYLHRKVSIPFSSGLWFRVYSESNRPQRSWNWFQSPFHRGCGSEIVAT